MEAMLYTVALETFCDEYKSEIFHKFNLVASLTMEHKNKRDCEKHNSYLIYQNISMVNFTYLDFC